MIKAPVEYGLEWLTDKVVGDFVADYILAFPILIGVAIGVYALCSMISKKLASLGVVGVFVYGALIVVA